MKKIGKILALFLLLATLAANLSSCAHKSCPGMKGHNSDVKRGLAH